MGRVIEREMGGHHSGIANAVGVSATGVCESCAADRAVGAGWRGSRGEPVPCAALRIAGRGERDPPAAPAGRARGRPAAPHRTRGRDFLKGCDKTFIR